MKKFLSLVAVMAVAVMASSTVWAATTVHSTKTAKVTFSSVPLSFDVKIFDWVQNKDFSTYSGTEATEISFNIPNPFELGSADAQWLNGKTIAKISSNLKSQPAGTTIYVYTDNVNGTGDFKANAARVWESKNYYSGLVRKGNTSSYINGDIAEMFMIVRSVTEANDSTDGYKAALPDFNNTYYVTNGYRKLNDISDTEWATYAKVSDKVIGITGTNGGVWHWADDEYKNDTYTGAEDAIIFFGAKMYNVFSGDEFGTNQIKFATITE